MSINRRREDAYSTGMPVDDHILPRWFETLAWIAFLGSLLYALIQRGESSPIQTVIQNVAFTTVLINPFVEIIREIRRDGLRKTFPITWKSGLLIAAFVIAAIGTGAALAWSV